MTSIRWMTIAALTVAGLASAPVALAKTSIAKGKSICQQAVEAASPDAEKVRVNSRKIRSTDTALIYPVIVVAPGGEDSVTTCVVDRETGATTLLPAE